MGCDWHGMPSCGKAHRWLTLKWVTCTSSARYHLPVFAMARHSCHGPCRPGTKGHG